MIIILFIEDPKEYYEPFKLKLHHQKSVEDGEKSKTKRKKMKSQTQGNYSGDAISLPQVNSFNAIRHS